MSGNPEYSKVLKAVSAWPAEERASLAHALIDTLKPQFSSHQQRPALEQLVGIARGPGPAPTDEQVKQWVDDARTQKYGK
jgi:hypothetical protein